MNIVVLDGLTRYSHYLDWSPLAEFGALTVHDRTAPHQVIDRAADADVILVNGSVVTRETLERLPRLKYIGILITGYDLVDVAAAAERGIVVTNVQTYATRSVAQMVFAHVLNLTQRVQSLFERIRRGEFDQCTDELLNGAPLRELEGLTMGIVGFGRIGRATAELALAFGMKVHASDPCPAAAPPGTVFVALDALFKHSDVVSLHCPLTHQTRGIVDRRRLGLMKPSALLINTSRGQLIDEEALADALNSGRIAGAGLDVLSTEPPPNDHPLLAAKNCVVTPHAAAATRAAWDRQLRIAVDNLAAFLQGSPKNVVVPTTPRGGVVR
jgi:glycerate dehydrogenase